MPGVTFECVFDEVELWAEKDPRDAQTSGGMTEGLSFDMTTVPARGEGPQRKHTNHWADWRTRLSTGYALDDNGCHVWQRSRNTRGYGVIYFDGKVRLAHRAAFYARHGRWPLDGLVVDHICENKACVNADHLRELTNSENIRRAWRHLDPDTEPLRIRQRAANARYRLKQKGGE
jgi:hypothetical protein